MSLFDLVLTSLSEIGEKILNNNDLSSENIDFVFGLLWRWYQFPKLSMSILDVVLTALSEIGEKILNNNDI